MKKSALLSLLLFIAVNVRADYLITSRAANIKEEPVSSSTTMEHVEEGARLTLLDNGAQTEGYYRVTSATGHEGWIYRTLVRRYADGSSTSTPATTTNAPPSTVDDVEVTVIDVGAGLSSLIKIPGNKYIIYDGGRATAMRFLKPKLPAGTKIEALILSHTDADHWGAVEEIVKTYKVKKVIRTSYRDGEFSETYKNGLKEIESAPYDIEDYDLGIEGDLQPGQLLYNKDDVKLYALCGFKKPLTEWGLKEAKANNAISIVVRLEYKNKSMILAGDAVGREDCDETNKCIATEKYMLDKVTAGLLDADVLVAAHHGADNSSCDLFINKVSPDYVVFSAGHAHRHPRQATVERFINFGVDPDHIFRTDKGDFEQTDGAFCKKEYSDQNTDTGDDSGDDHVRIVLPSAGKIQVKYLN